MYKVVLIKGDKEIPSIPFNYTPDKEKIEMWMEVYHADSYRIDEVERVDPSNGGCWFCQTKSDDMVFDTEFDTFLHLDCLKTELQAHPGNPEAQLMKYLLN
jgi:hypothetical protein